jgi:hypothetical protein
MPEVTLPSRPPSVSCRPARVLVTVPAAAAVVAAAVAAAAVAAAAQKISIMHAWLALTLLHKQVTAAGALMTTSTLLTGNRWEHVSNARVTHRSCQSEYMSLRHN